jgi:hypothetical protein
MRYNCQHKVAVNQAKYPEKSMNLKRQVAYHHEADALSGNALPYHHTDRIATQGRYGREGTVTWRTRRQIVIYRNDRLLYTETTDCYIPKRQPTKGGERNKEPNELTL